MDMMQVHEKMGLQENILVFALKLHQKRDLVILIPFH